MKLFHLLFRRDLRVPMLALALSSAVCAALVAARIILLGQFGCAFLVWNLFLAWLPMIFALLIREHCNHGGQRGWKLFGLGAAWILFFPNSPYLVTDLVHLTTKFRGHYWADMILLFLCALTGLVLGFISLYVVQSVIARRHGNLMSWLFVAAVAGLSGVGVFLGRFVRLNSWDVLLRPANIFQHINNWLSDPFGSLLPYVFPVLFATFLLVAYLMFYALTFMPRLSDASRPPV
jgi:uncharacterized membrane protein